MATETRPYGTTEAIADERDDLLGTLATHRAFLRYTVQGLTDDQARERTTVSAFNLGGLIKHVTEVERNWAGFIADGPAAVGAFPDELTPEQIQAWEDQSRMLPGEKLEDLLAEYEQVAAETDKAVRALPDLDTTQELPPAPWFTPGVRWSHRRVLIHILAETAQHSGHADIIRESLDGQKTMG